MLSFLDYKLINDYLNDLENKNYVIDAINYYNKNDKSIYKMVSEMTLENKSEVLEKAKQQNLLKKKVISLLSNETNHNDINNVGDLVSIYILDNFMNLCHNKDLLPFYKQMSYRIKALNDLGYSPKIVCSIALRYEKIAKDLYTKNGLDAVKRLTSLIAIYKTIYATDDMLVRVYLDLFDNDLNKTSKKISTLIEPLLNNQSILADSIIEALCCDKQFLNRNPIIPYLFIQVITLPINISNSSNIMDYIQVFFENDLNDSSKEAKFLDLDSLLDMIDNSLKKNDDRLKEEVIEYMKNIQLGKIKLKKKSDGYGNI